jgi:hypothetical protein
MKIDEVVVDVARRDYYERRQKSTGERRLLRCIQVIAFQVALVPIGWSQVPFSKALIFGTAIWLSIQILKESE